MDKPTYFEDNYASKFLAGKTVFPDDSRIFQRADCDYDHAAALGNARLDGSRFTADFFNIWNHANFNSPGFNDVENPGAFGKIFSTVGTPRLIQFQLRYAF